MNIKIHYTGSSGNLIQVEDLLIDPGVPIKKIKKALDYQLSGISGCLVSHSHGDHSKGLRDLLKCGVDCYLSKESTEALGVTGHRVHVIESMEQFRVKDWKIKPFSLVHDVPNLGFLLTKDVNKILYACDTNYIPYRFKDLTHIILGVNYDAEILKDNVTMGNLDVEVAKRTLQNHLSLQTAKDFFRVNDMSKVREIYLIHLSNANSNEQRFREEVQAITGRPVYIT